MGRALAVVAVGGLLGAWALTWVGVDPLTALVLGGCVGMSAGLGVAAGAGWLPHR